VARSPASRFILSLAAFVVVVAGLRAAAPLVLPVMVAVFLAVVTLPMVAWLHQRRVPRPVAVLCTVAANMAGLAGIVVLLATSINEFTAASPRYQARLHLLVVSVLDWLAGHGIEVPPTVYVDLLNPAALLEVVRTGLVAALAVLSNIFLVLLTLVFLLFEAPTLPARLQAALGGDVERLSAVAREIQRYLALKTLLGALTGLLVGGWVAVVGVDFALLWGLIAFALNYIPNLGSILAAVPPVTLALIQLGPGHALVVVAGYLVVNLVLGNIVEPYVVGRRFGLSTLVVFLSLVFWGWVWGPVGMLLAVPLTMIVKVLLDNSAGLRWLGALLDASPPPVR
jgi:AI-2 transport protein TqsA